MTRVILEIEATVLRAIADEVAIARSILLDSSEDLQPEPAQIMEAVQHALAAENMLSRALEGE